MKHSKKSGLNRIVKGNSSSRIAHFLGQDGSSKAVPRLQARWAPSVEAFARDDQFILRLDLPGFTGDDVSIEIVNDVLTVRAERENKQVARVWGYYSDETSYVLFSRKIQLPQGVHPETAIGTIHDGVLLISMQSERARRDPDALTFADSPSCASTDPADSNASIARTYRPLLVSVH